MKRTILVPVFTLLLAVAAIAAVILLENRANASRDAQLRLAEVKTQLSELQAAPFRANPRTGGSPTAARAAIDAGKRAIYVTLAELRRASPPPALLRLSAPLRANFQMLDRIYWFGASGVGYNEDADRLAISARHTHATALGLLAVASKKYDERASLSQIEATAGSAFVILVLLGAFGFFYGRSVRVARSQERVLEAKDAAQDALNEQGQELRIALGELEAAQRERTRLLERTVEVAEHERIRVAADLHDGPIQQLTAVALNFDRLAGRLSRGDLAGAEQLVRDSREHIAHEMVSLRRLMSELRPPILDEGGLSAALHDCAGQVLDSSVKLDVRSTIGDVSLAPEVETVVYRVAREALVNIRKHADAETVTLSLDSAGDALCLVVTDDGKGFDANSKAGPVNGNHYGLLGMRERVESVGGDLRLLTVPGAGTRIEATLPWKQRLPQATRQQSEHALA